MQEASRPGSPQTGLPCVALPEYWDYRHTPLILPSPTTHLALNAGQAATAGLRVTDAITVTTTILPGLAQHLQLPLLLSVNPSNAGSPKESPSLPRWMGLEEIGFLQAAICHGHCQVLLYRGVIDGIRCERHACP
jgi:hypothetical protein